MGFTLGRTVKLKVCILSIFLEAQSYAMAEVIRETMIGAASLGGKRQLVAVAYAF
jgi:hypothetical protein